MQIAKVVPKVMTRGEGIFDYAIPPQILPDIKIGVLVLVPFHGRKVEGIVVGLNRSTPIQSLKPLISLIDPYPVVDDIHIKLAHWMSEYYLAPFSKCLFEMIVPPAKRTIKKQLPNTTLCPDISEKNTKSKKFLIVADFPTRLKFYLQAIKKTIDRGQQVIILVPDLSLIPYFTKFLKCKIAILHAGLAKTQRWLEWDKIRRGEVNIVIGSNSALFSPFPNLGLVIIDQEENETYKSGQSPRFNAISVAKQLTKLTNANLVMGSITPCIETYYDAKQNRYLFKWSDSKIRNIEIVDMNSEKNVISQRLQERIDQALLKKQKILLVLNRKGEGTKLQCQDCQWIYNCNFCGQPLIPYKDKAYCKTCEKIYPTVQNCPQCQSINLKNIGLTTAKLKNILTKLWPEIKKVIFEKNGFITSASWDIAITTNFGLKLSFPKVGLVAIIDSDQNLNMPDFKAKEAGFQSQYKFLNLTETGIIQTHHPQSTLIKNLAKMDYGGFISDELKSREKYNFPPFKKIARLIYRGETENNCQQETQKISSLLKKYSAIEILGPSPLFNVKKNKFLYYQIVVKYEELNSPLSLFLKSLPKGWTVDIEPFNLL